MIRSDHDEILNGVQVLELIEAFGRGLEDSRRNKGYRPPSLDPGDGRAAAYQAAWELFTGLRLEEYHLDYLVTVKSSPDSK